MYPPNAKLRESYRGAVRAFMMERLQVPDEDAAERLLAEFLPGAAGGQSTGAAGGPSTGAAGGLSAANPSVSVVDPPHMQALLVMESAGRLPKGAAFYSADANFERFGNPYPLPPPPTPNLTSPIP